MANFQINLRAQSLLARVLLGALALAVVILLFFFLAAMLVVGSVAALAILARLWWTKRGLKQPEQPQTITAEYTVLEREPAEQARLPDQIPQAPPKEDDGRGR
jgi:predicted lipid-binding transport protein (Tim44 family)